MPETTERDERTVRQTAHLLGNPWKSSFGTEAPFALGVEEELLLIGPDNQLVNRDVAALRDADPAHGGVDGELFKAMIESRSDVCSTAADAVGQLRDIRRELLASGSRILGAGLHPNATSGDVEVRTSRRYLLIENALQGILRTPICGQHIHIGMPDEETAVRAYNGIRAHVPLINALAANSAFWFGEDSGLASARTVIFRSYPRAAMAPEFRDFQHFLEVTRQVCLAGGLEDYTQIWWDVRIHPALGTIEVRAPDTQTDVRRAAAIAALVHCLTRLEAERGQPNLPAREALAESSFQATRHGLDAQLLNREGELLPARELARCCVELASEVAGELGCEAELAEVEVILETGNGADQQRADFEAGGMDGLLRNLAERTAHFD